MDILRVLNHFVPNKLISFKENSEETLSNVIVWNSELNEYETDYPLPTQEECEEYWNSTLKTEIYSKTLRRKRDSILEKTDKYTVPDYPHPTPEARQAWLDYRQALRDLPANTEDPANPIWPVPPE
tara:strand:+ start:272 stop:649 length:378 start_codon:yes stop_codon:yes gene_type:complete